MNEAQLLTIREVARRLSVPIHRLKYAIAEHGIDPRQRAGIVRLWSEDDMPAMRAALARTASRKGVLRGE